MRYRHFTLAAVAAVFVFAVACSSGHLAEGEITPQQALEPTRKAYSQFIDVRTEQEFAAGHAERARNIPLDELSGSLDLVNKQEPVYLICKTGRRSGKAAEILRKAGFEKVYNIAGGTDAWRSEGLPMAKTDEK